MNSKVSVILSVYNTEKYLSKCLNSIINQSLKEIEIIVINDGSPDNSIDIIKEFADKDRRITYVSTKNQGVSKARNLGMELAKGEYIIFIDSDDYMEEDMLEQMVHSITKSECLMCVCNLRRVFDTHEELPFFVMPKTEIVEPLRNNADFIKGLLTNDKQKGQIGQCVSNKMFEREFVLNSKVTFQERSEIFAEDALFLFKLLPLVGKFSVVDQVLYNYYQRKDSVMNTYKPDLLKRWKAYVAELENCFYNSHVLKDLNDALRIKCFTFLIEILYNEVGAKQGYKRFLSILQDGWILERVMKIPAYYLLYLTKNERFVYDIYKLKFYLVLYYVFILRVKSLIPKGEA